MGLTAKALAAVANAYKNRTTCEARTGRGNRVCGKPVKKDWGTCGNQACAQWVYLNMVRGEKES